MSTEIWKESNVMAASLLTKILSNMGANLYLTIHLAVLFSTIFELGRKDVKKYILWFWILFFTSFGGLRWGIGGDWDQYYFYFENCSLFHIFDTVRYGNDYLEPGFVLLQAISKIVLGKFYVYNILLTFFYQYTIMHICKKYSPKYPILMYAFIITETGTASYAAVRAGLATSIMYWAYLCIEKRELRKFLLLVFIGANIHVSSLVLLPFYWVGKIRFNYISASVLYFAVAFGSWWFKDYFMLISMVLGGNIAYKAEVYTNGETVGYSSSTPFGWILYYILFMLFIYMRKYSKNEYFYNTLLVLYFILRLIMMTFSDGMGDLTRLGSGLGPMFPILVIFTFTKLVEKKTPILVATAFMLYFSISFYYFNHIDSGYYFKDTFIPYKSIFDFNRLEAPQWQ